MNNFSHTHDCTLNLYPFKITGHRQSNISLFPLGILGLIGYVLEAIVLSNVEFNTPSFLYHKTIVAVETVLVVCLLSKMTIDYFLPNDTLQCISYVLNSIQNICGMTVEFVAFAVSIERLIALTLPTRYPYYNTKRTATIAISICFVFGFHYAIDAFRTLIFRNRYYDVFRLYRDNLEMVEGFAVAVLSCIVSVGIVIQIRKHSRLTNMDAKSASNLSTQLCLLSISLSVPIFLDTLMWQICEMLCANDSCQMGQTALSETYDVAVKELHYATASVILNFWADFLWGIAHIDHFYVYLLLSKRFQKVAYKMLWERKSKVLSISRSVK